MTLNNPAVMSTYTTASAYANTIMATGTISNSNIVNVNGKFVLNVEDMDERLKRIEDMLHILQIDVIMEEKYNKLKLIHQEYNETLQSLKQWDSIKESK